MASDLAASLKPWSIEGIVIDDRVYTVPALPASAWLTILLEEPVSLFSIVPGLLQPEAEEDIQEVILAGRFSHEELEELVLELIGIASGRPWWTALYLLANAKHANNVDRVKGELALHGIDATRISLSAWLDAVYVIFIRPLDPKDRQKFDLLLAKPPPGIKAKADPAANRAALRALMASG